MNRQAYNTERVNRTQNVRFYPFVFNGKEKDYESGFHYYGARYHWSEVLTGWLSVDPLADKYPNISPYNYCMWNPIKLADPNGEKPRLFFHGEKSKSTFVNIVNSGLGKQFEANLTRNRNGSYTFDIIPTKSGGDVNKLNEHQRAFYDALRNCIDAKTKEGKELIYDIDVYYAAKDVHTGNYIKNAIDVADMNQFNELNDGGATKQGKLIHEFEEQRMKAYMGNAKGEDMGYKFCHKSAIVAENKVNGNRRDSYDRGLGRQTHEETFTLPNGEKHHVKVSTSTAIITVTQ